MNVLMYPVGSDDDFPDEFCAIRQGSGEHWFYTPAGEDASWMLFRAESDNAKLRELVRDMYKAFMHGNCYRWCEFKEPCNYISDGKCQWYDRMRELGVDE